MVQGKQSNPSSLENELDQLQAELIEAQKNNDSEKISLLNQTITAKMNEIGSMGDNASSQSAATPNFNPRHFCPSCGFSLTGMVKFCSNCGKPVGTSADSQYQSLKPPVWEDTTPDGQNIVDLFNLFKPCQNEFWAAQRNGDVMAMAGLSDKMTQLSNILQAESDRQNMNRINQCATDLAVAQQRGDSIAANAISLKLQQLQQQWQENMLMRSNQQKASHDLIMRIWDNQRRPYWYP